MYESYQTPLSNAPSPSHSRDGISRAQDDAGPSRLRQIMVLSAITKVYDVKSALSPPASFAL